ncbi:hypothetical protein [Sutcliffiella halmapala]|uniref:hypothetical protein n=1 Tax=Sutcliffiella halmapala TaxID=79882 RepID=UPI000994E840|nr:hypothetical protein [Sutcliffiella halmapala]
MKKIIIVTLLVFGLFYMSPPSIYGEDRLNKDYRIAINKFLPSSAQLVKPENPKSTKSIQFYDFDRDGKEELIITFEIKAKVQPNPSQFGAIILRKENEKWEKIWETQTHGAGLDFSGLFDITGDGVKEYLFGVTIGAAAGNNLEIFKWSNHSLNLLADVPYHRLEVITNEDVGIAVWRRYIADTYFVDVLKWNGKRMVPDEGLFVKYYPEIEKFHKEKITKMDAWFYWYTLADAQIKANLFDDAANSIKKGVTLAEELLIPEIVKNFNQLNEKLNKKRSSN